MASAFEMSIFATAAAVAGPAWFARAFRDLRIRRLIENTPTARIRSMAMGLVELNGEVLPRSGTVAPFSGRPCVYWQVDISTSGRRNSWTVVHRNSSGHPFYLKDDTGVALIQPRGADCSIAFGVEERVNALLGLPECYSGYMEREGLGMRHLWRLGAMRFRERTLEEGQRVYVLGRAFPKPQSHVIAEPDEAAEQATGTDGWRARRLSTLDSDVRGVLRRGEHDPVFLISQQSERTVALQYGLHALAGAVLGPALAIGGLATLLWLQSMGRLFR